MNKMKLTLAVFFTFGFTVNLMAVPEGAFSTLMVQAKDVNKYIDYMKNNPETFEAIGASDAGVCVTRAGNNYPGEMFVWSAFPNLEGALAMVQAYDPFNPDPAYKRLRVVVSAHEEDGECAFVLPPAWRTERACLSRQRRRE